MSTQTRTPATERQTRYLRHLLETREVPDAEFQGSLVDGESRRQRMLGYLSEDLLSKEQASQAIAYMLEQPEASETSAQPNERLSFPDVIDGRYAVEFDGKLRFFKAYLPSEGPWARQGRIFLSEMASDEHYPVKDTFRKSKILAEISKDVREASLRYGREIGSCGVCGRTLTDEESRARGIGPVCAAKVGW